MNTNAARYQNLSFNKSKLSGQCGRLKCCLNYELDTYMDALQFFPTDADMLEVAKGRAFLVKKDIFRNLMWYTMAESNKQYPLTIETVKKIKAQNKEGIRPEEMETVEVTSGKPKEVEPEYADIVGQISLKSLEKTTRKRRDKERSREQRPQQQGGGQQQRSPQQNRGGGQQRNEQGGGQQQRRPQGQNPNQGQGQQQGGQQRRPQGPGQGGQGQQGGQGRQQRPPQNRGPQRPPQPKNEG